MRGILDWYNGYDRLYLSRCQETQTVSHQLVWLFDAGKNSEGYIRIEPDLNHAKPDLDDASTQNMNALREAGHLYIKKKEEKIESIVTKLIDNKTI